MTTSNTVNYSDNRTAIIQDTLTLIRVTGANQVPSDADVQLCNRFLNRMIKQWQAIGLQLWATQEAALFTAYNQSSYTLGSNNAPGGDHASNSYVLTTTSASALNNASTLTLTTVTGMTIGDNIGFKLSTGIRQWTTISNINTNTKIVTLTANTINTVSSNATVITYTTKLNRPMDMYSMRRFDMTNSTDVPLMKISHQEYYDLPLKSDLGTQLQFFYDPQLGAGNLLLWPTPNNVDIICKLTYLRPLQDVTSATQTLDFPIEWNNAIIYNLAVLVAPAFGKLQDLKLLEPLAGQFLKEALDWDNERTKISIVPDPMSYNRLR